MRVPRLAVTLALGLGLVGAAALVAAPATPALAAPSAAGANPAMPGMDMNMPGMDHGAMAGAAPAAPPKQDRSAGIERSRLKPVFLEAHLDGRQEVMHSLLFRRPSTPVRMPRLFRRRHTPPTSVPPEAKKSSWPTGLPETLRDFRQI